MWWKISNEMQYIKLRMSNRPKIFIWLSPAISKIDQKELKRIVSIIHDKYYPSNKIIISLVEVNRDPMLKELMNRINPSQEEPLVTGYLPNGASCFKSHELSLKMLEKLIHELLMTSHN